MWSVSNLEEPCYEGLREEKKGESIWKWEIVNGRKTRGGAEWGISVKGMTGTECENFTNRIVL